MQMFGSMRPQRCSGRKGLGTLVLVLGVLLVTWLSGCTRERVVRSSWDKLAAMGDPPPATDASGERRVRGQAWAVKLTEFRGDRPLREAYDFAQRIQRDTQLPDVWFLDHGDVAAVYAGRFPREDHPDAEAALRRVRDARLDGRRPFHDAKLVAIDRQRGEGQGIDEHDLRQFSGYLTLLLAVYDIEFGRDYRTAAEDYADQLRRDHDQEIYYYHGPNQSIVTSGLFTFADFVPVNGVDTYGPEIRALQEVFPHALRNGKTIENPEVQTEDQLEPSIIVRVP